MTKEQEKFIKILETRNWQSSSLYREFPTLRTTWSKSERISVSMIWPCKLALSKEGDLIFSENCEKKSFFNFLRKFSILEVSIDKNNPVFQKYQQIVNNLKKEEAEKKRQIFENL